MQIESNFNLSKLNTFGIAAKAKFFVEVNNEEELRELFADSVFVKNKKFFLGGGSNILFTKDFDGIVILNKLKGIEIKEEFQSYEKFVELFKEMNYSVNVLEDEKLIPISENDIKLVDKDFYFIPQN